jgi:hypothetical protein
MSYWKSLILTVSLGFLPSAFADANAAFARLKSLAGTWTTSGSTITYTVVSAGSAVMETADDMITMYYLDGATILATHYCDLGNQPRMRATNFDNPDVLEFDYVDITNLKPGGDHISGVEFNWQDDNHLSEDWTYIDGQGNSGHETFSLVRAGN